MKKQTPGALYAPQPAGVNVPESGKALNEQVNNLQRRYYRSLAPDCEKLSTKVCGFKKNRHLCSDFHLIQATRFANRLPLAFFMPIGYLYSSVPCGALMSPQPDSGGRQRGAELFLFSSRNNQHIVSF